MTNAFDPDDDPAQVAAAKAAKGKLAEDDLLREDPSNLVADPAIPRDAATLILVRMKGKTPEVLMGCRAAAHAFMTKSLTESL